MKHLSIRRAVIALFALVGLLDALYLSIERLTNQAMACPTSGGCEAVQASSYSAIFGIPVAFIGVVGYSIMLMLAMMSLSGVAWGRISAAVVLAAVALAGVLFSGYLVYLQLAVIHAVCFWCILSATMEVGIAALAGADLLRAGRGDAPPEELPAR